MEATNIINGIAVNKDIVNYLKLNGFKIQEIRYGEMYKDEYYLEYLPAWNSYRIRQFDINNPPTGYSCEGAYNFKLILWPETIYLTRDGLYDKFCDQLKKFKRPAAYYVEYAADEYGQNSSKKHLVSSPHFNKINFTYFFIESIDADNKVTFEKRGYRLK